MAAILYKLGKWLLSKAVLGLVLIGISLLALCLPLFLEEWVATAERRVELRKELVEKAKSELAKLDEDRKGLEQSIRTQAKAIEDSHRGLEQLRSWYEQFMSLFPGSKSKEKQEKLEREIREREAEQSRLNDQMKSLENSKVTTEKAIAEKESELAQAQMELEGRLNSRSDFQTIVKPKLGKAIRWGMWLLVTITIGPIVAGVLAFYLLAPFVERAEPIRLGHDSTPSHPTCSASEASQKITLSENDELVVREDFLQGSQEALKKSTCWVWHWRYPVTCLLCGLVMLTRVRLQTGPGSNPKSLTLSHEKDGVVELAKLTLAAGEHIVFRPHFLVGLLYAENQKPKLESRWLFNRLQSWATLQFRHFMIHGPVVLLLAAGRGVQEEVLTTADGGFRVNQNLTIGFSPGLQYGSRRAETLMAFLRKKNPLFDNYFRGEGRIYNQRVIGTSGGGSSPEGFWGKILSGLGKLFGL